HHRRRRACGGAARYEPAGTAGRGCLPRMHPGRRPGDRVTDQPRAPVGHAGRDPRL
ncbi:uncharacterized protein METZ01_LOCUS292988, partial [marine metagenome]